MSMLAVFAASMFSVAVASAEGPYWSVGGTKLAQGASKGITLQSKGALTLKSTVGGNPTTITCLKSEGKGTIDSQGATLQGQGKGIVKYEECKTLIKVAGEEQSCTKPTTLTTNQLKTHLAKATVQGVTQGVEILEPSPGQTTEFISFVTGGCTSEVLNGLAIKVKGCVVGQIVPQSEEVQEGLLAFPEPAITSIVHEGQKVICQLNLGAAEATFGGAYSAKLQSGEKFGIKLT